MSTTSISETRSSATAADSAKAFQETHNSSVDNGALHDEVRELVERVRRRLQPQRELSSTYRLQFQGSALRFCDASHIAGYIKELGVSHVYASPLLKAKSGSTHGYDVVDPTRLNDELGSWDDFTRLVDTLHGQGLGQVLDIVPNHMSVANDENHWWMDVLRHGPASRYAAFFDVDWEPVKSELNGRVLLPILDGVSGAVLEAGRLPLRYVDGEFFVGCNDSWLPLDPKTCVDFLTPGLDQLVQQANSGAGDADILELESIIAALTHLPERSDASEDQVAVRHRESLVIRRRLKQLVEQSPRVAEHIESNLRRLNGTAGDPRSFDALDTILEKQAYRLVHWKASSDEINYRRFFDVTTLAALSVENLSVFEETHALIFRLAAAGQVDGLRVDHVDGLFDPSQYLWRLQWGFLREIGRQECEALRSQGQCAHAWSELQSEFFQAMQAEIGGDDPSLLFRGNDLQRPDSQVKHSAVDASGGGSAPAASEGASDQPRPRPALPVVVEKILGADEPLPLTWPVMGTTGYEFLNTLNGLFVEPQGMKEILRTYERFVQEHASFEEVVYQCKRLVLSGPMQSEIQLLGHRLDRLSHHSRHSRDFTLNALQFALREIIACFSVYRTYIRDGSVNRRDEQIVHRAVAQARRRNPAIESETFEYVKNVLLLNEPETMDDQTWRQRELLVGRFQQVTSPVQAKGVEDTAFYRYIPLLSLEEVGGEPTAATKSIEEFHQQNLQRQELWPHTMLTTTTHDTKRSEDVRARINVLSEIPGQWRKALQRWHRLNRKHLREVDGEQAPSRNDEWLLYQSLVGVWPTSPPSADERKILIERLQQYMEKATHEAKERTSWISPSVQYDTAVKEFVAAILADASSKFSVALEEFVASTINAGLLNAAAQVLLKLTAPGRPDIYQGQELWDFSLVDPDNRRPVDYQLRSHLLGEVQFETSSPERHLEFAKRLAQNPRDNRLKLLVTRCGLQFRQKLGLGQAGLRYVPLEVSGQRSDHICAFAWYRPDESGGAGVCEGIVVAPRWFQKLTKGALGGTDSAEDSVPSGAIDPELWSDTALHLPAAIDRPLLNHFTGQSIAGNRTELSLAELLKDFPLGLLS